MNVNYRKMVAQRPVEGARSQLGATKKVTGTASVIEIGTAITVITNEMMSRAHRNTDVDTTRTMTDGKNAIIVTVTTGIGTVIKIRTAMAIGRAMTVGGTGLSVTKIARTESIATVVGHLFREVRQTIHDTQWLTKVLRRENANVACFRIVRIRYVMLCTF